jgi:RNA polymerase sigma-70 factor (ECF subfamily)
VCRKGHPLTEAQDLTQEFFAWVIARNHFRLADRTKGKFRGFLLSTLDLFLAREWRRAHRQKRGGHITFVPLDAAPSGDAPPMEPADHETPETHFLRQWALTVLKQAMDALQRECEDHGKGSLFRQARHLISGERDGANYEAIGRNLAMSEGALRVAVHRLRQRYGELLREEIAGTVPGEEEVDEELRFLFQALAR